MVRKVLDHFGKLHNAGINKNSAAEETPLKEWDKTFAANLRDLFVCCQEEGRHMLKAGSGKIINTASMSSVIVPHPQKQAAYNTSKAGVAMAFRQRFHGDRRSRGMAFCEAHLLFSPSFRKIRNWASMSESVGPKVRISRVGKMVTNNFDQ